MKNLMALSISVIIFLSASLIGYNFFIGDHARNTVKYKNTININLMNYDNETFDLDIPLESTISEVRDPVREDYLFDGWYLDSSYIIPLNENRILADGDSIYAKWLSVPLIKLESFFEQVDSAETLSYKVEYDFKTITADKFESESYLFVNSHENDIYVEQITGLIYELVQENWMVSDKAISPKEINFYKFLLSFDALKNITIESNNIDIGSETIKEYVLTGRIDDEYSKKIMDGYMSEILEFDLLFELTEGIYERKFVEYEFDSSFEIIIRDSEVEQIEISILPEEIKVINKMLNVDPTEGLIDYEILSETTHSVIDVNFKYSDFKIDDGNINFFEDVEMVEVTYNYLDFRINNDTITQPINSEIVLNNTTINNKISQLLTIHNRSNFYGWYLDESFSIPASGHILDSNITVYANINLLKQIGDFIVRDNVLLEYIGTSKNIVIPSNLRVEQIGPNVFKSMEIESVVMPEGIEIIGRGAFENNRITEIIIPSTVTYIDDRAFYKNEIDTVDLSYLNIDDFGSFIFAHNYITNVSMPLDTQVIPEGIFYSNRLELVDIYPSVIDIRKYAFHGNFIEEIIIPENITVINEYAFSNNNIINLNIPDNILEIKDFAFYGNLIEVLTIGSGVTTIGEYAFANNYLTNLVLPNNISQMGDHVFRYNFLESVTISTGLTDISRGAFQGNLISSLHIPSNIVNIRDMAFYDNAINYLYIPSTVNRIESIAFFSNNISDLEFENRSSDLFFGSQAFNGNSFTDLIIPNGVQTINNSAFLGIHVENVYLPSSVTHIQSEAFRSANITNITFSEGLQSIGYWSFRYSTLTEINLPNSLSTIGERAFANIGLTNVTFGSGLISIGTRAFESNSIDQVSFPSTLRTIGQQAFRSNNLTTITLPASLTSLGWLAFSSNSIEEAIINADHSQFVWQTAQSTRQWSYYGIPNDAVE